MCGLEWGRLYETYHKNAYNPAKVWARAKELYADECVRNRRGIFEYVLGGERDANLEVRGNGCRPRRGLVEGRRDNRRQLPDALQDAQSREGQLIARITRKLHFLLQGL